MAEQAQIAHGGDAACYQLPDGSLVDLSPRPPRGARAVLQSEPIGRHILRHSTAHVMAQAVLSIWPFAKYAIGPPIEDPPGFYYDFDIGRPFNAEDLERIEARMGEIIEEDQAFIREEVSLKQAAETFANQPFKLEIIDGIGEDSVDQGVIGEAVSLYHNNGFVDLCRGPHLPSTGKIKAFKLLRSSGAYWRGDSNRPMLQRIYGTAWESREALEDYFRRVDEAERRDHVRLGRELDLFMTHDLVGSGMPIWLPKGATIRRLLEEYILDEERRLAYQHVYSPDMGKQQLYITSGHWEHFKDDMFPPMELEHETLVLKPMNCPHHVLVYSSALRSYRDLPIRIAELGRMHRYERSGVVRGLSRVRTMTLNDAHIFCRPDQVRDEFADVMRLVEKTYSVLGITEYSYQLSLRDPYDKSKYVDNDEMWELGERVIREAMEFLGLPYSVAPGEASFYGPKLDIQLRDILGREETYSTIQVDFHLPEQFDLRYIGEDGQAYRPVMIHRAIISSLERIVAYLIELYAGWFPTWLAPVQAIVVPIAERHREYAHHVAEELRKMKVRVEVDESDETLNNRVRKAQTQKIPYLLVAGDNEVQSETISVRHRHERERRGVALMEFLFEIGDDIVHRKLPETTS
jgi:threonyl-tRNA synthetase